MNRLPLVAVVLFLATRALANDITLPPCGLDQSYMAPANACQIVDGFGTTTVFAGVAAIGGAGTATGTIDIMASTAGPVRPGFIDISLNSYLESSTGYGAQLQMAVGDESCSANPFTNFCYINGSSSDTGFLPFMLGVPFEIQLSASVTIPPQFADSIIATSAGALSFSVYEEQSQPVLNTALADGVFHSLSLESIGAPGESVPILQEAAAPEPGSFYLAAFGFLLFAIYRSCATRRRSSSRISISRNSVR